MCGGCSVVLGEKPGARNQVDDGHNECAQPCGLECTDICAAEAATNLAPIDLSDARTRFEKEAKRGVLKTAHYRMPYYTWGEGPPLVFVHGVADSSDSFLMPVSRLSANFRCVAYNLPTGRGDGARVRRWTHEQLVCDLFELIDHLGLKQAYLFGSSFGSTIVVTAMARHADRIPRGVLQGGLAYRPLFPRERWLARIGQYIPGTVGLFRGRERVMRKINGAEFEGRPEEVWRYFIERTAGTPIATLARQALALDRVDLRPLLPQVRQPVLLISGDRDAIVPERHQEMLLAGLPNAGRVTIRGCAHVPSYTHPEALAEVVRQFLTPPR
jgi:pimeloyl-ACP methyl ester carboxylesterase